MQVVHLDTAAAAPSMNCSTFSICQRLNSHYPTNMAPFEKITPLQVVREPGAQKMGHRYQKGALNWTLIFLYIMYLSTYKGPNVESFLWCNQTSLISLFF